MLPYFRIFILLSASQCVASLNILMYNPGYGLSHMRFMGRISDILLEAGHSVTEIRPILDSKLDWSSISNTKNALFFEPNEELHKLMEDAQKSGGFLTKVWNTKMTPANLQKLAADMRQTFVVSCKHLVFNTDLISKLQGKKFDLAISESFDSCGFGIFEMLNIHTTIATSSTNLMDHQSVLFGVPRVPSYVPGCIAPLLPNMTMVERVSNAIEYYFGAKIFLDICDAINEIFVQELGPNFPSLRDVQSKAALLFTNSHPYIDFPRPTIFKVIDIGGIHLKEDTVQPLNKEWDEVLNRKSKTVLISFGSIAKSYNMPPDYKKGVIETARLLPDIQFIWKYEKDDLQNLPLNLYISKWTPQASLLADKRLKLFVTHGGLGSITEIAHLGIPAITIPLFGDQPRNAFLLKYRGVGAVLDKFDIANSKIFAKTITDTLNNPSYQQTALKLKELLHNVPFKPKELLLKNVEFVGKFGNMPQLDPYGRQLTFAQYYLLDVFALLLGTVVIVIAFIVLLCNTLYKKFTGQKIKAE